MTPVIPRRLNLLAALIGDPLPVAVNYQIARKVDNLLRAPDSDPMTSEEAEFRYHPPYFTKFLANWLGIRMA